MRVSRWAMPVLGAVLLFGSYGIAEATGTWVTSGKVAVVAGRLTPAELKGWMTIRQAAEGLGVPPADLLALVAAPAGSGVSVDTAVKDLEALVPGFSLTTFRATVTTWLATRGQGGGPTSASGATTQPSPTAAPSSAPPPPRGESATPDPTRAGTATGTGTGGGTASITGAMTLRQVAQATGVALARLIAECGLPAATDPDLPIKSLKETHPGFEVQTVRDAVTRIKG